MDGLNAVIPFKDPAYYAARPSIALAEPASGDARAIDLDGFYALHPALASLVPIYSKGHLAIVHAAGSPDNTRSHFDAQDYMEIGTPGVKSTPGRLVEPVSEPPARRLVEFSRRRRNRATAAHTRRRRARAHAIVHR
jgi:uncharacterized protein (DUF1501 family)